MTYIQSLTLGNYPSEPKHTKRVETQTRGEAQPLRGGAVGGTMQAHPQDCHVWKLSRAMDEPQAVTKVTGKNTK